MRTSIIRFLGVTALAASLVAPLALAATVPVVNTILTPGGHSDRMKITAVPAGGQIKHVGKNIHVLSANGTVVHIAKPAPRSTAAKARALAKTGWITFASWLNTGAPIGSFKTSWNVPPVPVGQHGQLLYLFNAIEPANGDAIMQPVLQYGISPAGGGQFWGVASWYLYSDQVFHSSLVPVSVGQRLDGEVQLVGVGNGFDYNSQFTNIQGTGITVVGGEQLALATITLEAYGVTVISDYPAGKTVFSGINLELSNGQFPGITWSTLNDDADGLSTVVDVGGSTSATIEIRY
ncbi:hypothetical protein MVEN_00620100 [Mycena venus]|uniref:Uncharacterized protein n=1 Tax=Mycena venus TaxID=2733690 RepID=A0A8H6YMJ3_9AGAR|nr:hypothetical protein MVEN_00620100 [Mycena venus]